MNPKFILFILTLSFLNTTQGKFASKKDGEFVTMTGVVKKVNADSFNLKTKNQMILIEMDDDDWESDGYKLVTGDEVVVSGIVDKDFLENRKIEAGSVYVKSLNTYFYASSMDEEGAPYLSPTYTNINTLPENSIVEVTGKVISINDREFTIYTGLREVTIDTKGLLYNPMDDKGFTQIDKGDRVTVSGIITDNFFGKREIDASTLYEVENAEKMAE